MPISLSRLLLLLLLPGLGSLAWAGTPGPGEEQEGEVALLPAVRALPPPAPPVPEGTVKLAFVGDILLASKIAAEIREHGVDYPWTGARPFLEEADLAIGNLETAVATVGRPAPDKQYTFRSAPRTLAGLARSGIDLVSLANNHTLDFGREALIETLEHVDREGLLRVGAGRDREEAEAPVVVERNGIRMGFLSFSRVYPTDDWAAAPGRPGVANGYTEENIFGALERLREEVDVVVVLLHWGAELASEPREKDRRLAEKLRERGAHLIIGHHPHVLQGFQWEEGGFVAYSLGNFVFTSRSQVTSDSGVLLLEVNGEGRVVEARFEPMRIERGRPGVAQGEDRRRILARLDRLSGSWGAGVGEDGRLVAPGQGAALSASERGRFRP